jgi:bacteriorhodopsin
MIVMIGLTFLRPRGQRVFHHLATIVLVVTTIAYFSMASDLGSAAIVAEKNGSNLTRAIWYVRYIQWTITWPIIVTMLLLPTGIPTSDIFAAVFITIVLTVDLLVGSLVHSSYKWGYYSFALVALIWLWYQMFTQFPHFSNYYGAEVKRTYWIGSGIVAFAWLLYPICWALSEGSNKITPTGEMVFYGLLDMIMVPLFLFYYTWAITKYDYNTWGLRAGKGSMFSDPEKAGLHQQGVAPGATSARPSTVETATGGAPVNH